MDLNGFDATQQEPMREREPIPEGDYSLVIVNSETKDTATGTGSYLKLEMRVAGGPHDGRAIFVNLNLNNKNPDAVRIAREELSSICRAVGVMQPRHSADLHNKPFRVKVGIKASEYQGERKVSNTVRKYYEKAAGGAPGTYTPPPGQRAPAPYTPPHNQTVSAPPGHPTGAAAGGYDANTPPWQR